MGIDLHGVLTDIPDTMKFICESLVRNGAEVHIMTGGSMYRATQELHKLGLRGRKHFTHIFSVLDYHRYEMLTPPSNWNEKYDNPEYPNDVWDRTKGDYCQDLGINLMIDDSLAYREYFTTPFARIWTKTDTPKVGKPQRHLN